jgi:hypothetical protein
MVREVRLRPLLGEGRRLTGTIKEMGNSKIGKRVLIFDSRFIEDTTGRRASQSALPWNSQ